jgi:hypothetical protein
MFLMLARRICGKRKGVQKSEMENTVEPVGHFYS